VTEQEGPLVSVIIPAFNVQDTLSETVRSATAGTYRSIEVIIVDDGNSSDATSSIAQELADADHRVRIIRREKGWLSEAVNSGFAAARGDYVARLDGDDLWHPSKLQAQVDFAIRHPDAAFIYTFARYIDSESRVMRDGPRQSFPRRALCRGICESVVGGGSSALIKRSAVQEAGGWDGSFRNWEDLLLQLAVSSRHPIGCLPSYLVGYRVRPHSLSKNIDDMLEGWRAVRAKLAADYPEVPHFVRAWAHAARCAMFAEGFAWRGRYLRSLALLAEAMRHDPKWVAEFFRFRLARRTAKTLAPTDRVGPGPHFFDSDPERPVMVDWFEQHPSSRRFTQFEQERWRILAELDEQLARDGSLPVEIA
jgi:glycosyltransferase involved in cell wall biosynthesis